MKQSVKLSGKLLLPLKEGERAAIQTSSGGLITSPVVEIIENSSEFAHFETMNSVYRVALVPHPIKAALPKPMAMCA